MKFDASHGVDAAQHQANFNKLSTQGFRMISLSACAGLAASATALIQFIHVNLVWGNGPRWPNSGNWWLGRTGSTAGASTEAASLSNGIDWAYVINTRDFPPQTSLSLPSLATTIGNLINSTPGL